MDKYGLYGLQNFIFKEIKKPLFETQRLGGADIQGIEERYIERLLNMEDLTLEVHNKVVEKLTDTIAEKVVNRIIIGASLGIVKTKEEVDF